jgi:predicted nucleic acid-binding protein
MKILLDSDFLSALGNPHTDIHKQAIQYIAKFPEDTLLCVSLLTIYEMQYGIAKDTDKDRKERVRELITNIKNTFSMINLSFSDAEIYGEIKNHFEKKTGMNQKEIKKHNIDIALASVAIANNCILVSRDKIYTQHLQKIDTRLKCQNW